MLVLRLRPLAFATFLVWRLRIGACGVGAIECPPPKKKINLVVFCAFKSPLYWQRLSNRTDLKCWGKVKHWKVGDATFTINRTPILLYFLCRPPDARLVFSVKHMAYFWNCHILHLLRYESGTQYYEEPKTFRIKKYFNSLQCRSSDSKHLRLLTGKLPDKNVKSSALF